MLQNINSELWDVNPELQEEKGIFFVFIPWRKRTSIGLPDKVSWWTEVMLKQLKPVFPNNGLHLKDSGLMPPLTESTEAWLEQDLKDSRKDPPSHSVKTHVHSRHHTITVIQPLFIWHLNSDINKSLFISYPDSLSLHSWSRNTYRHKQNRKRHLYKDAFRAATKKNLHKTTHKKIIFWLKYTGNIKPVI